MNAATARLVRLVSGDISLHLGQHSTRGWGKLDVQTLCQASSVFGIMMVLYGFGCIQDWFLSSYSACQFLSIFANLFMHNKKCHPLLPQFCFFVFWFDFLAHVLHQNRQ